MYYIFKKGVRIIFKERLKLKRKELKLTQSQLGKMIGVSDVTIANYENGKREPNVLMIKKLSKALNTNGDYLLGLDNKGYKTPIPLTDDEKDIIVSYRELDKHSKSLIKHIINFEKNKKPLNDKLSNVSELNIIKLKVYEQKASAGLGRSLLHTIPFEIKEYKENNITKKADHVILIDGDSMSPTIKNGQEIFVKEQTTINNNEIGVFIYDDVVYCKRLCLDYENKKVVLKSDNKEYKDIYVEDEELLRTIGKVLL